MMQNSALDHLVLSDGEIVIRSAHPSDEPLLAQWFSDPEVYKYWGGVPLSDEAIAQHCSVQRTDDTCWPFIIVEGGEPAGFVQAWMRNDMTGGLDLFIAPQRRRKGVASRTLPVLAKYLRDTAGWRRITVDPNAGNAAAIALYERTGFVDTGERFTEEDEPHMLMEFRS